MKCVLLFVAVIGAVLSGTPTSDCAVTAIGATPLSDVGVSPYPGIPLGLYPGGLNVVPPSHLNAGLVLASGIKPRKANGQPHPNGRIGLVSIGMSNARQEFAAFMAVPAPNTRVTFINGAQGGVMADEWADPTCLCWGRLDGYVAAAGLTAAQVSVVWIKLVNEFPAAWPDGVNALHADLAVVVQALAVRFPNLTLAYLSSRTYGGYATTLQSPEPHAYDSAFAVRGLIEAQLNGDLPYSGAGRIAPWLAWGPYLWADGLTPRSDGLTWACSDFETDGGHPGPSGESKVADLLRQFFLTHPTTMGWFIG